MNVTEEQVAAIRRMWTFQAFVWGLRFFLLAVPPALLGDLLPGWVVLPAVVLAVSGVALALPLRVQAFFWLDIPYMTLFWLGMHYAFLPFTRSKPAAPAVKSTPATKAVPVSKPFRNPEGLVQNQKTGLLVPMAPPSVLHRPVKDRSAKLAELRKSGEYRLSVWGYRLMLASVVGCCGGVAIGSAPWWAPVIPILGFFVGVLLTFPVKFEASHRLWLSPGRIMGQALKDMFNPTFF